MSSLLGQLPLVLRCLTVFSIVLATTTSEAQSVPLPVRETVLDLPPPYRQCPALASRNWENLLSFRPEAAVQAKAKGDGWNRQAIENASSEWLNLDFYSVEISRLPKDTSPEQLLELMRARFNYLLGYDASSVGPAIDKGIESAASVVTGAAWPLVGPVVTWKANKDDSVRENLKRNGGWNGTDVGSQLTIPVSIAAPLTGGEKGSPVPPYAFIHVLLSYRSDSRFILTTGYPNLGKTHPVSGSREFGFLKNKNGGWTFYTRGADRPSTWIEASMHETVFAAGEQLWTRWQTNLVTYIESKGGDASIGSTIKGTYYCWSQVALDQYRPTAAWIP